MHGPAQKAANKVYNSLRKKQGAFGSGGEKSEKTARKASGNSGGSKGHGYKMPKSGRKY